LLAAKKGKRFSCFGNFVGFSISMKIFRQQQSTTLWKKTTARFTSLCKSTAIDYSIRIDYPIRKNNFLICRYPTTSRRRPCCTQTEIYDRTAEITVPMGQQARENEYRSHQKKSFMLVFPTHPLQQNNSVQQQINFHSVHRTHPNVILESLKFRLSSPLVRASAN
jgi:hypothetical protein